MWWGGFSELKYLRVRLLSMRLNPHVVGRFFRENWNAELKEWHEVLIPMWWGGFSESGGVFSLLNSAA